LSQSISELQRSINEGFQAWVAGDAQGARHRLETLALTGSPDPVLWLGLAYARRDTGDHGGALDAANRVLQIEPRNPAALIVKGDALAKQGGIDAALGHYQLALKLAPPDRAGAAFRPELERAARAVGERRRDFVAACQESLAQAGIDEALSPRFAQSMAIMRGERAVFPQRPLRFFFACLPATEFFDAAMFEWARDFEARAGDIRAEAKAILADRDKLVPYVEGGDGPEAGGSSIAGSRQWTAFFLRRDGALIEENARQCPATMAAMAALPRSAVDETTQSVLFSVIEPGAHIPPHNGMLNTRLICHLPVIAPAGCRLRVGGETRDWRQDELMIFDDSIEHEAWNEGAESRVVLLFDIWRPDLSAVERQAVQALLASFDRFWGRRAAD
jgi:aspartyl/asparaginyl beta-hydroxylase (cupin superfamily)